VENKFISARHEWGDDFDFSAVDQAAMLIERYCRRWGRIFIHGKEKWGQVRCYVHIGGFNCLHTIIYPGYAYSQFPKWLWVFDIDYIRPLFRFLKITKITTYWQIFIYNRAYQKALKKFPHIKFEILVAADHKEIIKGSKKIIDEYRRLCHDREKAEEESDGDNGSDN
jgi:hypothetical protein